MAKRAVLFNYADESDGVNYATGQGIPLPAQWTGIQIADRATMPMTKSQFDVCGATITTNRGRFGNSPSMRQPVSRMASLATPRENAFPRVATASPSRGMCSGAIGIAALCAGDWIPARTGA